MLQTSIPDALAEALNGRLVVLRRGDRDRFEDIQTVAISWLDANRNLRAAVEDRFGLKIEQLVNIVGLKPTDKNTPQTKTWARCAAALLLDHPQLKRNSLAEQSAAIEEDAEKVADAGLSAIRALARQIGFDEQLQANVLQWLKTLAYESREPERYRADTLSDQRFSEGLREALQRFNSELRFLTIQQVGALDASLSERRLWIQGPAGSGKTIVGIEAAYRTLRAGFSCAFVYRSTQFKHILPELLDGVPKQLYLLPHFDFVHMLNALDLVGRTGDEFKGVAKALMPGVDPSSPSPLVDRLILDDCGTFGPELPGLLPLLDEIAHRIIVLAAPDQLTERLLTVNGGEDDPSELKAESVVEVLSEELSCPRDYYLVSLSENLRNARAIANYARGFVRSPIDAAVRERGSQKAVQTSWEDIDETILAHTAELLKFFPPSRIKILVDPFLEHPTERGLSLREFRPHRTTLLLELPPIARTILAAASGGFLHINLGSAAESELRLLLHERSHREVRFVATDGVRTYLVSETDLITGPTSQAFDGQFLSWHNPVIDAAAILDSGALEDAFGSPNVISIYPTPLFIGLESDVVIYVRNQLDTLDHERLDPNLKTRIRVARNQHHFLAISRAKYHLVDMTIA